MILSSTAFKENDLIPAKYTCDGENVNPPLKIAQVPAGAKSLVLIINDPDAPGGDWVHWIIWNISPQTTEISENSIPAGSIEGVTDFDRSGYGGPCPPSGVHHYHFMLYALDITLNLPASTRKKELEEAIKSHILASNKLVGLYARK